MSTAWIAAFAVVLTMQHAVCVRVDDVEDPSEAAAIAEAKKKVEEEAQNIAATVSQQEKAKQDEADGPPVVFAPPAPDPIVIPMKPAIIFAHEGDAVLDHVKSRGILDYDRDGSGDLDAYEFRGLIRDSNHGHHDFNSDSEIDEQLHKWDKDEDDKLSKQEAINYVAKTSDTLTKKVASTECNAWSPPDGEDKGHGSSCDTWGFQNFWCWIAKDFEGPGAATKQESQNHPGKWFAPCKNPDGFVPSATTPAPKEDKASAEAAEVGAAEETMKQAAALMNKTLAKADPATREASSAKAVAKKAKEEASKKQVADAKRDMDMAAANAGNSDAPATPEVKKAQKDMIDAAKEMAAASKTLPPAQANKTYDEAVKMAKAAKDTTGKVEAGEEPTEDQKLAALAFKEVKKAGKTGSGSSSDNDSSP